MIVGEAPTHPIELRCERKHESLLSRILLNLRATNIGKEWYVRDRIHGQPRQVWLFENETATLMGVTNPERGAGTFFRAEPGESFLDCIRRHTSWLDPRA